MPGGSGPSSSAVGEGSGRVGIETRDTVKVLNGPIVKPQFEAAHRGSDPFQRSRLLVADRAKNSESHDEHLRQAESVSQGEQEHKRQHWTKNRLNGPNSGKKPTLVVLAE